MWILEGGQARGGGIKGEGRGGGSRRRGTNSVPWSDKLSMLN